MQKYTSLCPEKTWALGEEIGKRIPPGTVLALYGDLGAGKTLFAQGLAKGLGVLERVKSPTFTLMEEYKGRLPFIHIDAYRLTEDEIWETGLLEAIDGENIVLIEWAGNLGLNLPPEALKVVFEKFYSPDAQWREIIFNCPKAQCPWLSRALAALNSRPPPHA